MITVRDIIKKILISFHTVCRPLFYFFTVGVVTFLPPNNNNKKKINISKRSKIFRGGFPCNPSSSPSPYLSLLRERIREMGINKGNKSESK